MRALFFVWFLFHYISESDALCSQEFHNGITNKLFGFHCKDDKSDTVLVRINGNGTDRFLDRKAEVSP